MNSILVCLGLLLIGLALQVSRGFWYAQDANVVKESSLGEALRLLGYLCITASIFPLLWFAMGPFAIIALLVILFSAGDALVRNSLYERRTLAWLYSAAARHQVPLPETLSAFYSSPDVHASAKGSRLIAFLSLGMPLPLALRGAGVRLTPAVQLATALSAAFGGLSERVTRAIAEEEKFDESIQRLLQKTGYTAPLLVTLALFGVGVLMISTFVFPALSRMDLPYFDRLADFVSTGLGQFEAGSLFAASVFALLLAVVMVFHQYGFYLWNYPVLTRLAPAFDRALLYQTLAVSFRRGEPLPGVFEQLGTFFPRGYIRSRLRKASLLCAQGTPWLEAMQLARLVPNCDRSLLASAELYGDASWTLEMLAQLRSQRQIQRLETAAMLVNVLLLLALGGVALLYGLAVYSMTFFTVRELV